MPKEFPHLLLSEDNAVKLWVTLRQTSLAVPWTPEDEELNALLTKRLTIAAAVLSITENETPA